jgi:uncharacterized protein (DUF1501 family)
MIVNRRTFLRRSISSALGGAALYSALGNLKVMAAAANLNKGAIPNDYRALVCVFLYGGNDSANTLVPFNETNASGNTYARYAATRPAMAVLRADTEAQALMPLGDGLPGDGASYGLHPTLARVRESDPLVPAMTELRTLFNGGQAAVVANVGALFGPITRAQYQANPGLAPPQLFSHDDQANFWQTSRPDDANADGWGGRIADLLYASNPNQQLPMTMSLSSQSLFQRGSSVDQYVMQACSGDGSSCGVERISYLGAYQNELGTETFNALMAAGVQSHLFERAYGSATRRSIATYERLRQVLGTLPVWTTPFPQTSLGQQLRQVANLINVRGAMGLDMRRQIFFVSQGGYDTHDDQLATHPRLLRDLSRSLDAFYRATAQMGIADSVTSFTASDFGRTLSTNGDGTDHGWGGHHFVLGGAVRGQRFYGSMNSLAQSNNPDDAGYGQIIPTTGVDQYAATLATWFGVAPGDLGLLFPGLANFDVASRNLGFMNA